MTLSGIAERQNLHENLRLLAAQRQLYNEDKQWTHIWYFVTAGVAILGTGALVIFVLLFYADHLDIFGNYFSRAFLFAPHPQ